ncbi:ELWxxDGT repeat protein [Hyunsoonleella rubra]|uniref:ELWxxDGT repeat protein n=1 Tax=Hyunsoonleella rubra TaxID=1737062 RepID=A0ABW5TDX6_9FLAO
MRIRLLLCCLLFGFSAIGQVSLVDDINPTGDASPLKLTVFKKSLYFTANDGTNGRELWQYNGTNTTLFDINTTAGAGSSPTGLFPFQGNLYLSADDGNNGKELWRGDGTSFSLFLDINSGSGDATPNAFVEYNGQMVFTAFQPLPVAREPMISDGTVFGTQLLADVSPVTNTSSNAEFYTEYNGNLYFSGASTVGGANGVQFYVTDGTGAGTQMVKRINSSGDAFPRDYIVYNNLIYFTAEDGVNGRELWVSDGTNAGTQLVQDLYSGPIGSSPGFFTIYNNRLYFKASHATLGTELFYVNTSGSIVNAANINPGSASSLPSCLKVFNGKLYFSATDGTSGTELWETSGTAVSTVMTKNINPGSNSSSPKEFTEYNGKLYFNASEDFTGAELWVTNGTSAGTIMVADINPSFGPQGDPEQLTVFNNKLLFVANNGTSGRELFEYTDPTLSVQHQELNKDLTIYPNPVSENFKIDNESQIKSIVIYNIQGKEVKVFGYKQSVYGIANLKSGLYFAEIVTDRGVVSKKIIKH